MQPTRRHVPPSALFLLDADGLRAELRGPDRGRVAARAAAEDGDVKFHDLALSVRFAFLTAILSAGGPQPGYAGSAPSRIVQESIDSITRCDSLQRVAAQRLADLPLRLGVDHEQRARLVADRPAQDDEALGLERVHELGMRRPAGLLLERQRAVPFGPRTTLGTTKKVATASVLPHLKRRAAPVPPSPLTRG